MEQKQHYFFAVKLPSYVKQFLKEWVDEHKSDFPFKKWVHQEDYHITLAFLGFAEESMLQQAKEQIKKELSVEKAFSLTLHEIGTFGKKESPRIFWADVQTSDSLTQIQKKVYNICKDVGFALDKKPFRPHITLARKWNSESPFQLLEEKKNLSQNQPFTFKVNEIVLYKTHLQDTPKYKEVFTIQLVEG